MPETGRFPFVDSHVHHWLLSEHQWYPVIQNMDPGEDWSALGDMSKLRRDYSEETYRADSRSYDVQKIVHISATTLPGTFRAEARWVEQLAASRNWPAAMIGTFEPSDPIDGIAEDLASQAESRLFRGVRLLEGLAPDDPKLLGVYRLCAEGSWIFELVSHPEDVKMHVEAISQVLDCSFVVEHTGWPLSADAAHFALWRKGLQRFAELPNVWLKISGLPMTLMTVRSDALRPWVETAIADFGVGRCFFGSNFPVDAMHGTFDDLLGAYCEITQQLGPAAQHELFVTNAEQLYRV